MNGHGHKISGSILTKWCPPVLSWFINLSNSQFKSQLLYLQQQTTNNSRNNTCHGMSQDYVQTLHTYKDHKTPSGVIKHGWLAGPFKPPWLRQILRMWLNMGCPRDQRSLRALPCLGAEPDSCSARSQPGTRLV